MKRRGVAHGGREGRSPKAGLRGVAVPKLADLRRKASDSGQWSGWVCQKEENMLVVKTQHTPFPLPENGKPDKQLNEDMGRREKAEEKAEEAEEGVARENPPIHPSPRREV